MSKHINPLIYDTYLAVIKNSVGSKEFRNFYAKVSGRKEDIMKNGDLSCAFFVTSILVLFNIIKRVHTTVESTIDDLRESGWQEIKKPKVGSILVWEKMNQHGHIVFYIGNNKAISNNSKLKYPAKSDWQFNGKRNIEHIFWNSKLR